MSHALPVPSRPGECAAWEEADALIVGAGPVGLYAAYYAGFRGLSVWALTLSSLARPVTLVHRRESLRAHEALVRQVRDLGVPVITSAEVTSAGGDAWIEAVDVWDKKAKTASRIKAQAVIAALGFTADISAFEAWGLRLADRRIAADTTMVNNAVAALDPAASVFPGHSSDLTGTRNAV